MKETPARRKIEIDYSDPKFAGMSKKRIKKLVKKEIKRQYKKTLDKELKQKKPKK